MLPESPSSAEPGHPHQGPGSFFDLHAAATLRQPGARLNVVGGPTTLTISVRQPGLPLVLPPRPCRPFLSLQEGPAAGPLFVLGVSWALEGDDHADLLASLEPTVAPWWFPPTAYHLTRGKNTAITAIAVKLGRTHMDALADAYPERVVRLFLPRRTTCVLRHHPSRALHAWSPLP